MIEIIKGMFNHMLWADKKILRELEKYGNIPSEIVKEFAHIAATEQIWLSRIKGEVQPLPVWPDQDIKNIAMLVKESHRKLEEYMSDLTESELEREFDYKNIAGVVYNNTVRDVLTHLSLHNHYHRGRINLLIRRWGKEPIPTDYIIFLRD